MDSGPSEGTVEKTVCLDGVEFRLAVVRQPGLTQALVEATELRPCESKGQAAVMVGTIHQSA